jgi:hypothetical protein
MVEVAKSPIAKLDVWFPKQVVMDAMGIIYPQYWLKGLGFGALIAKGYSQNNGACHNFT